MIRYLTDKNTGRAYETDPHQLKAYAHLVKHKRAALFLEMSLSKTVVALSYLYDMHYIEALFNKTVIITTDKVARITWPEDINKWAHLDGMRYTVIAGPGEIQRLDALNKDAELYIVSVDSLDWFLTQFKNKKHKGRLPFSCMLIDESSLFKSRKSKRFKSLKRAIENIDYRIIMTGTAIANGYIDLWAQMYLIDDGKRLGETFETYVYNYFTVKGNGMIVYKYLPKIGAVDKINKRVSDIVLTMKTREHIKLAPFFPHDEILYLSSEDLEIYNELEAEYVLDTEEGEVTVKTSADLVNKLLQLSGGAIYEDLLGDNKTKTYAVLNTVKIDALAEIAETYDENMIVVYSFKHEAERIKKRFPHAVMFSDAPESNYALWNKGKIKMLLMHPASGGHGLNLQHGGRRMVWFTPTHNLDHYLQMIARLVRRGVDEAIHLHRLIVEGTRDKHVYKAVDKKENTQDYLMREIKLLKRKHNVK